ncbi:MAG: hypothetical protein SGI83_07170 [Bacteroidota bacterium]|nr:hypothetical protein [Bacteroidota bacterium]
MKKFLEKYKLQIDLLSLIVSGMGSIMAFIEYPDAENRKMKIISAIAFGIMAIAKTGDFIEGFKKRKEKKLNRITAP